MTALSSSDVLRRHQARRVQGVPTVTSLVGPVALSIRAWREWTRGDRRPSAVVMGTTPVAFLTAWVEAAFAASSPEVQACAWLAAVTRRPVEEFARAVERMTRYDLEMLWRSLPLDPQGYAATAAFLILSGQASGIRTNPLQFVRNILGRVAEADAITGVVRAVVELYPSELWPALLLVPHENGMKEFGLDAARTLERMLIAEPRLSVAVALSTNEYDGLVTRYPDGRAVALLREGFVELVGMTRNQLEEQLRTVGMNAPPVTLQKLTDNGLSKEVSEAFVAATQAVRNPTPADEESDFRSVHEEFLFELLESMPQTVGLFRPNHPLGFRHGPKMAEGDLVAESLKLVVEVDGGHYHLTADQYCRDRRKDWLYQRHGYLVLRFLAETVVSELETVLDTILEAVAWRRSSSQPTGVA